MSSQSIQHAGRLGPDAHPDVRASLVPGVYRQVVVPPLERLDSGVVLVAAAQGEPAQRSGMGSSS